MAFRTFTFTPNPLDTVGAPLPTPLGFRVWLNGTLDKDFANPQPNNTFVLALNPGEHLIEIAGLAGGVEGVKVPYTYIEPSGIPGPIDPASIQVV